MSKQINDASQSQKGFLYQYVQTLWYKKTNETFVPYIPLKNHYQGKHSKS